MKLLRAGEHKRMPWKNGGGETVEIAVSPAGSGLADFDWRVSTATVAADGPFSIFPGIDRTLSILRGEGMRLSIEGREPVLLTRDSEPLAFAADIPVSATLPDGAITDLNVMTRRGAFVHRVERLNVDGSGSTVFARGTFLLFCADGALTAKTGAASADLSSGDALLLENSDAGQLDLSGRARCYAISIETV